jgi:hypothetical protein
MQRFQFTALVDRLFLEVPWREAERIHDCLVKHGIPATVCFEPYDQAGIDFPRDVDRQRIEQVLSGYLAAQAA